MLGRFYEARGLTDQAIVAYRKSLEVEWNQPDITQAIERLEN